MLSIVLAGRDHDPLASFAAGLWENDRVEVTHVDSAAGALKYAGKEKVDVMVVGEELADMAQVEFIVKLVRLRPAINIAMVSALSPEAFHETTEGLGVLMQLPPIPSREDAAALLGKVEVLSALAGRSLGGGKAR